MMMSIRLANLALALIVFLSLSAWSRSTGFHPAAHADEQRKLVTDLQEKYVRLYLLRDLQSGLRAWEYLDVQRKFFDFLLGQFPNLEMKFMVEYGARRDQVYYAYAIFVADSAPYLATGGIYHEESGKVFKWDVSKVNRGRYDTLIAKVTSERLFNFGGSLIHRGVWSSNPAFVFITLSNKDSLQAPFFIHHVNDYRPRELDDIGTIADSLFALPRPLKPNLVPRTVPLEEWLQGYDSILTTDPFPKDTSESQK